MGISSLHTKWRININLMILDLDEFKGYLLLKGFVNRFGYVISADDNICLYLNGEDFFTRIIYYFPPFNDMEIDCIQSNRFFKYDLTEYDGYNSLDIRLKMNPVLFDIKNNGVLFRSFDNRDIFNMKFNIKDIPIYEHKNKVYVEI